MKRGQGRILDSKLYNLSVNDEKINTEAWQTVLSSPEGWLFKIEPSGKIIFSDRVKEMNEDEMAQRFIDIVEKISGKRINKDSE
jgi:hypothetical protein